MKTPIVESVAKSVKKEFRESAEAFQSAFEEVRHSVRGNGSPGESHGPHKPLMMDPVRFKKILVQILKLLIIIELVGAFLEGLNNQQWGRFGFDLVVAGILYAMWEKITAVIREQKETARRKMESSTEEIRLWDALIFSLLWTDEIYTDIPPDRRRLVVIAYTLIALGLVATRFGTGLMPLVVAGALVLGAVNLVSWVVSAEREERESLQTELKLARDVQISLMPKSDPVVEGFDIAGMSVPAREVGGDLFDYGTLGRDPSLFGVSVFDVSGKGMQAAMSAVFTSGALASEARQSSSPAEIISRLNRAVYNHSRRGHFVAFLLAAIDLRAKTFVFANAGQTKPLLRSGTSTEWLDSVGIHFPLGMKEDCLYEQRTIPLHPGDVLYLFTDGFTDAMNGQNEIFGLDRLVQTIGRDELGGLQAKKQIEVVSREIQRHVGAAPQHDDMTMVVVKVL